MSEADGPYLFDVGVIALAHSRAPVRDTALSYVQDAVAGEIDVVVPCPAPLRAHTVLTTNYELSNTGVARVLQNFMDAKRFTGTPRCPKT